MSKQDDSQLDDISKFGLETEFDAGFMDAQQQIQLAKQKQLTTADYINQAEKLMGKSATMIVKDDLIDTSVKPPSSWLGYYGSNEDKGEPVFPEPKGIYIPDPAKPTIYWPKGTHYQHDTMSYKLPNGVEITHEMLEDKQYAIIKQQIEAYTKDAKAIKEQQAASVFDNFDLGGKVNGTYQYKVDYPPPMRANRHAINVREQLLNAQETGDTVEVIASMLQDLFGQVDMLQRQVARLVSQPEGKPKVKPHLLDAVVDEDGIADYAMIDFCLNTDPAIMNAWENKFVVSINKQLCDGKALSAKQLTNLKGIYKLVQQVKAKKAKEYQPPNEEVPF